MSRTQAPAATTFFFTLTLKGRFDPTAGALDAIQAALLDAGCDDATVSASGGVVSLDFSRTRPSRADAVGSAIAAVEGAGYEVARVEIDPE